MVIINILDRRLWFISILINIINQITLLIAILTNKKYQLSRDTPVLILVIYSYVTNILSIVLSIFYLIWINKNTKVSKKHKELVDQNEKKLLADKDITGFVSYIYFGKGFTNDISWTTLTVNEQNWYTICQPKHKHIAKYLLNINLGNVCLMLFMYNVLFNVIIT